MPTHHPITRITHRSDFLKAAKAAYQARPSVIIQARQRDDSEAVRSGFTASKKVGNAVARNRAKRRMREVARALLPELAKAGHDYVFIAKPATLEADFQALLDDAKAALIRLSRPAKVRGI